MNDTPFLSRLGLDALFTQLSTEGYRLIGPRVEQGAILYRPLQSASQLPWGVSGEQQPGSYRLQTSDNPRAFTWANGPQALT